jgi:hypothetical protein
MALAGLAASALPYVMEYGPKVAKAIIENPTVQRGAANLANKLYDKGRKFLKHDLGVSKKIRHTGKELLDVARNVLGSKPAQEFINKQIRGLKNPVAQSTGRLLNKYASQGLPAASAALTPKELLNASLDIARGSGISDLPLAQSALQNVNQALPVAEEVSKAIGNAEVSNVIKGIKEATGAMQGRPAMQRRY